MHISTDINEPTVVASPIGNRVSVKYFDARYESGILAIKIAIQLCAKEIPDFFKAQKYPLKQKCVPARMQSHTYPCIY